MLVTTTELARHLEDSAWVIFDCRHDLSDPEKGARVYGESHIPGAHFASVDRSLSGPKTGRNGRHPLPAPQAFADFLASHGVDERTTVVGYDDAGGMYAARLWWLARWIGFNHAAVLDGGWQKWLAERRPVTPEVPAPKAGRVKVHLHPAMVWSAEEVLRRVGDRRSLVVDARAPERYRGEVEPIDPVAGHIPGAANRFYKQNLTSELTLRPRDELRAEFAALIGDRAIDDVAHQCGSGITACANLFAMEYAGLAGSKLYAGSWSEWVADPSRPVAKG
jgi:thiosulfate/3-mercaptopyruvate sulfurtransferase